MPDKYRGKIIAEQMEEASKGVEGIVCLKLFVNADLTAEELNLIQRDRDFLGKVAELVREWVKERRGKR